MGGGQSGGGGGGSGFQISQALLPPELQPLMTSSAANMQTLQSAMPLWGNSQTGAADFTKAYNKPTAQAGGLENWAAGNVQNMYATPESSNLALQYAKQAPTLAGTLATGSQIENDPALKAADAYFQKLMLPQIQNQMALAGLGRSSSLANAMALGQTNYMLPLVQAATEREQNAINNRANMMAGLAPTLNTMGATDTARQGQALSEAMNIGGTMRSIEQAGYDQSYQDYLRRQALAEQALFVPFGSIVPSTIGQTTAKSSSSDSGGGGGGLFK